MTRFAIYRNHHLTQAMMCEAFEPTGPDDPRLFDVDHENMIFVHEFERETWDEAKVEYERFLWGGNDDDDRVGD